VKGKSWIVGVLRLDDFTSGMRSVSSKDTAGLAPNGDPRVNAISGEHSALRRVALEAFVFK
jgi:hypothetical protein